MAEEDGRMAVKSYDMGGASDSHDDGVPKYDPFEFMDDQPALSTILILVLVVASAVGTAGNILILVAVATQRDLQNMESVFIVNLACADLYVTLIADPLSIVGKILGWQFFDDHPELCQAAGSLCTVSCVASLMTLATVSLNRYILITNQRLYHRLFTLRSTIALCCSFYLVGLFLVVLNFAGVGDHNFDHRTLECIWDRMANHDYTRVFGVVMVMFPIFLTGLCYARLYLRVRQSRMKVHHHTSATTNQGMEPSATGVEATYNPGKKEKGSAALLPQDNKYLQVSGDTRDTNGHTATSGINPSSRLSEDNDTDHRPSSAGAAVESSSAVKSGNKNGQGLPDSKAEKKKAESNNRSTIKLARTLFIIYIVFSACWLPYAVLLVLEDGDVDSDLVHLILVGWAHIHPSINWLVYYHTHNKFRAAFRKLLRLDRCCC